MREPALCKVALLTKVPYGCTELVYTVVRAPLCTATVNFLVLSLCQAMPCCSSVGHITLD
jgi:hypothetical protein